MKYYRKNLSSILSEITIFINKNFFVILILLLCCFLFIGHIRKKNAILKPRITNILKNSAFVGNGFFINDEYVLTTQNAINNACYSRHKHTNNMLWKKNTNLHIFILYKNEYYPVSQVSSDSILNLSLLKINSSSIKNIKINNYVLFEPLNYLNIGEKVYYYENINKPYFSFLKKSNIKNKFNEINYTVDFTGTKHSISDGSPILNKKLNVMGIISRYDKKEDYFYTINNNQIRLFLRKNGIKFFENKKNIDLSKIKNYLNEITAQIVCIVEENKYNNQIIKN